MDKLQHQEKVTEIPTEIKDKGAYPQLKKIDRQIIAYAVLTRASNQDAFRLFHPEFLDGRGKLNDAGKAANSQFWGYGKVKDYREQYEKELAEFLGKRHKAARSESGEIDDTRKDKALKALLNRAMSLVEDNAELDPDTLKTLTEIFKKTGLLKDEVEQVEAPRRYIPETCSSCKYKQFIDAHVQIGDIEEYEETNNNNEQ